MQVPRVGDFEIEREAAPYLFVARRGSTRVLLRLVRVENTESSFAKLALDESRLALQIVHPVLARLVEIGAADGYLFYAYAHVDGVSLRDLARDLSIERAIEIAVRLCEGLQFLHDARAADGQPLQCVHRDIAPRTIWIGHAGEVLLLDLMVPSSFDPQQSHQLMRERFLYLSPEQASGLGVDHRSDQYALASVLWELTVGEPRFAASLSDYQVIERLRGDAERPSARRADYPRALERILMRALSREPAARYASIAAFGHALATCTN